MQGLVFRKGESGMEKIKVGIIGPGNIGTDLMYKVMKSRNLQMDFMTGIVESEGLKRAKSLDLKPRQKA